MSSPTLCESGVKYYIRASLKEMHRLREQHISMLFNIAMALFFLVSVGTFLWCRYKGKMTPEEQAIRNRQTQHYIMNKLQTLSAIKKKMITDLPPF